MKTDANDFFFNKVGELSVINFWKWSPARLLLSILHTFYEHLSMAGFKSYSWIKLCRLGELWPNLPKSVDNLMILKKMFSFIFDQKQDFHQILWWFVCEWFKNKRQEIQYFKKTKFSPFDLDFCLTFFKPILALYSVWKYSDVFDG